MEESNNFDMKIGPAKWLMWLGIGILIFTPLLFTRNQMFFKWLDLDFTTTGQIGDTIGGITAPFINLIGAYLVYYSFKAQISANKKQFIILNNELKNNSMIQTYQVLKDFLDDTDQMITDFKYKISNTIYNSFR